MRVASTTGRAVKSQQRPLGELCINTIRPLAIDAPGRRLGPPRTPMGGGPRGVLPLRFDPGDPVWRNRDRLVLSPGPASMLLFALLHLTGVRAVSKEYEAVGEPSAPLEAIRTFRRWHSR